MIWYFGEAFLKHEEDRKVSTEQMREWRTALEEVSKIPGRHLLDRYDSTFSSGHIINGGNERTKHI